jgi:renalase
MEKINSPLIHSQIRKIAVIGAGISSLSFINSIKKTDEVSIDLFERSRGVSGRAATRKSGNYIFDNGASYIFSSNKRVIDTLTKELPTDELTTINKWMFPFDKENNIDMDKIKAQSHNLLTKYTYKSGISTLGKLLYNNFKLSNLSMHYSINIDRIDQIEDEGQIKTEIFAGDKNYGPYDIVLFGMPSLNIAKILSKSKADYSDILTGLEQVKYKKIFSLAIAFEGTYDFDFYALINSDKQHPISWLSVENEKEGHVNEKNATMLIVQMSNKFSEENRENQEGAEELIIKEIKGLLPQLNDSKVLFSNLKFWGHALPENKICEKTIELMESKRLYVIGDSIVGKGRVDYAMITGIEIYNKLKNNFEGSSGSQAKY